MEQVPDNESVASADGLKVKLNILDECLKALKDGEFTPEMCIAWRNYTGTSPTAGFELAVVRAYARRGEPKHVAQWEGFLRFYAERRLTK
ncbi:MAG: hypothetical protein JSS14_22090 [Proteobacteria bacterium]|nr:hypothetical protein [Pseudomonadota bacterium]